MPDLDSNLEIERIKNLIVNFGWELTKQKISDGEITLTISKTRPVAPSDIDVGAS